MGVKTVAVVMTVNRTSAIRVNCELLPVLWVYIVKSSLFNVLVLPSSDKRKKQKLIIFIVKHCNWLPCAQSACRQAK